MQNKMLNAALKYLKEYHFSVIPVGPDKKPKLEWAEFQKRLPSETEVKAWYQKWPDANVAIVTGLISNLCVFDTDDDEADRTFNEMLPEQIHCPIVTTPRGGKHYYFTCPDAKISNKAMIKGLKFDFRGNGGYVVAAPSTNGNGRQYQFLKSAKIQDVPLPPIPSSLLSVFNNNKNNSIVYKEHVACQEDWFKEGRRDNDLFTVANTLAKGGMHDESILKVLETIAKSWGEGHLTEWFQDKIKSALQRKSHREINVAEEVRHFIELSNGYFCVSDCYKQLQELQSVTDITKRDTLRGNIRLILFRLKNEGIVKPDAKRDGYYIRVDDKADEIQWWSADTTPYPIKYPFQIERFINTYPKNIIVIAGEPNAGKTAWLLNLARLNLGKTKDPITYISSEMGAVELKTRLRNFDDFDEDHWRKMRFLERSGNFADVINPSGITIIDFLELTDNFYLIADYMKQIYEKLTTGVCIIAIQKDKNKQYGRGGNLGLEKPRLYLTLGTGDKGHLIKIEKAKSWADPEVNPNGLQNIYKLVKGCKFVHETGWHKEGEL